MAALAQRPAGPKPVAENDIFTALVIIASLFIVAGTICAAYQFVNFYGAENLLRAASSVGG